MLTTALLLFQLAALVAIVLRVVAAERGGRARPRPARARRTP